MVTDKKVRRFPGLLLLGVLTSLPLLGQSGTVTESKIVAQYQGVSITQEELNRFAAQDLGRLQLQRIQFEAGWERQRHQVLEADLDRLLEDRLLTLEATQRGTTKEQLLATELKGKVPEPTENEVRAYYEANRQRINQPLVQISSQIFDYLKMQNYDNAKSAFLQELKKSLGVTTFLEPLRSTIETDGSPAQGQPEAPVTLVEFSDFQCPYCAAEFKTLRQVMGKYGTQVRLVYKNFPLVQIHPNAERAAEAGLCAQDQGRFWQMHDLMFQGQTQLTEEGLKAKAAQLNLDMDSFDSCMASGKHRDSIQEDLYAGSKLGISGTPALFINGRFVPGAVPPAAIEKIIDEELNSGEKSISPTRISGK